MTMGFLLPALLALVSACATAAGMPDNVAPAQAVSHEAQPWARRFVDNAGVRIEYRVRETDAAGADRVPVLFIPGMTGDAGIWEDNVAMTRALDRVSRRKLVAISLRGRGASDCPDTGWTPQDHHRDIAAVLRAEKMAHYDLVSHSMGVGYAVGFALSRPRNEIRNFVAADYFPAVMQVTEQWAQMVESQEPPLTFDPRMARHVLREQGGHDYAGRLDELTMPMLVILGRKSMEPSVEALYSKAPHHTVLWIDHGHMTFTNDEAIARLATFLQSP